MYEKLPILTAENLAKLKTLESLVPMTNKYIRLGESGTDNLSVYNYSKWSNWTRAQKEDFKSCFQPEHIEKSVVGWFLNFPENTGFLDKMNAWENQNSCGTIISYALESQDIWLNNTQIPLVAGEGIKFKLNTIHEVKTGSNERNWACIMMMI